MHIFGVGEVVTDVSYESVNSAADADRCMKLVWPELLCLKISRLSSLSYEPSLTASLDVAHNYVVTMLA